MSSSKTNLNLYFESKDIYANKKMNDEVNFDLLRASVKIKNALGWGGRRMNRRNKGDL